MYNKNHLLPFPIRHHAVYQVKIIVYPRFFFPFAGTIYFCSSQPFFAASFFLPISPTKPCNFLKSPPATGRGLSNFVLFPKGLVPHVFLFFPFGVTVSEHFLLKALPRTTRPSGASLFFVGPANLTLLSRPQTVDCTRLTCEMNHDDDFLSYFLKV